MKQPIIVHFMTGCKYCTKAKEMFAHELSNGTMVIASKSPGITGFPTFVYKKIKYPGLPPSKEHLFKTLKYFDDQNQHKSSYEGYEPENNDSFIGVM